ncbi:pyridoxamine 5'-phosphate oxidase family protein [Streptomyces sp. NPDC006984]|uniref:pyridoxamine 5'-phosphate oxidase family protein n=1 Tax=Streptomyces sp. NPDC006984 TaxID=3155463 RepID=UPI003404BBD1
MDTERGTYHHGSLAVQRRLGVEGEAAHIGRSIGGGIRPVAAAFLELQPHLVLAAADAEGRMWASLLTGRPGFVRATGPHSVSVRGGPPAGDPLAGALATGAVPAAALALDPRTRRRMRMGGSVRPSARGLLLETERVFSNCPKYIQQRLPLPAAPEAEGAAPAVPVHRTGGELDGAQTAFLRAADTFFIATGTSDGVDVSHRGGNPGFLRVASPTGLSWPDYPGNAMFLTLGNLERNPRAGILALDWSTGATLQLTGAARTAYAPGGARTVHFTVERTVHTEAASPVRWTAPRYSPANPALPQDAPPGPGAD